MTSTMQGYLAELFTSIQGEGLWLGCMQHFVRFAGCKIGCEYCDTGNAVQRKDFYSLEDVNHGSNPVDPSDAAELISILETKTPGAQAVTITGGEPLEQISFLKSMITDLKNGVWNGKPVMLETSGLYPEAMEEVSCLFDMVSMDIKLTSTSGLENCLPAHRKFLKAISGTEFYIKIVVNENTLEEELDEAVSTITSSVSNPCLFLQPETRGGCIATGEYLFSLWKTARKRICDVRIAPQIHPILKMK